MPLIKRAVAVLIPAAGVLAVTFILLLLIGADAGLVFSRFAAGLFSSTYQVGEILVKATPLLLAGLGCSLGFKCGFINLGAEGQLYVGALAATTVAVTMPGLPRPLLLLGMILAAFLAGGVWSLVPGVMKARFGLSEVIMCLMFNYIAIQLNALSIRTWLKDPGYPFPMSAAFSENGQLPLLIARTRLHAGILLALAAAFAVWLFLWKSSRGFQIRVCGTNPRASHCAGINVNANLILSALISGGLAGLAGFAEVAGVQHKLMDGISSNYGYLAVMVALLGKNHPVGVVLAALALAMLDIGGLAIQRQAQVPSSLSQVILGLIIVAFLLHDRILHRLTRKTP